MPKDFFQDMVKIKREMREKREAETLQNQQPSHPEPEPSLPPARKNISRPAFNELEDRIERHEDLLIEKSASRSRFSLWIVAGITLVFLFFALSFFFAKAFITINPKMQDVSINQDLGAIESSPDADLSFELVAISGDESKKIAVGAEKDAVIKATGTVIIYNNFSKSSQALAIDTRLEGSNGKMYKTVKALSVPGMKGTTPGSIEVGIYASEAGDSYNSGPLDFKIFGFKGTSKYDKFYARSKGAIAGGFIGKTAGIDDSAKAIEVSALKKSLHDKLFQKAADQTPPGFILFPDATSLVVPDSDIHFDSTEGEATLSVSGTLYGFLFDEKKLTDAIVKNSLKDYTGKDVYLYNMQDLTFTLNDKGVSFADVKNINFNLLGNTKVVSHIDVDKLASDIAGQKKKDFNQILSQYPDIDSANLSLRPFWKLSLPDTKKDIEVTVNYPK